jgi:hypothetical protein
MQPANYPTLPAATVSYNSYLPILPLLYVLQGKYCNHIIHLLRCSPTPGKLRSYRQTLKRREDMKRLRYCGPNATRTAYNARTIVKKVK